MISKAKILFYAAFKKSRPPLDSEGKKKLNFFNKLVLLQVRRYKRYREIPAYIGYFEWHQAVTRAKRHYHFLGFLVICFLMIQYQEFKNYMELKKAEKLLEKRRKEGLPDYPLWNLFGDNPYFHYKSVDHYRGLIKEISEEQERRQTDFFGNSEKQSTENASK